MMKRTQYLDQDNCQAWARELKRNQLLYPDERIVSFLAKNYSDIEGNKGKKALDIGFCSGRHLLLLNDYGFDVYGIDYNQEAIDVAYSNVGHFLNLKELKVADIAENPYKDGFFDLVIAWGVSFLRPANEMLRDLKIINNMLTKNGKMIVNFRNKDSWFYGKGKLLEEDTFILDETAGPYHNMCYTFFDFEKASQILTNAGFNIENSERLDLWKNNCVERHSWWVFWAQKA